MARAFWERYAATHPYHAVVTTPAYRGRHLDAAARRDFFRTGTEHVDALWAEIERAFVPAFRPRRALDFGCGVGRVTLALASRCEAVLGVDIASGMVAEARANAAADACANVTFTTAGDAEALDGPYDLVHSMVVLQHVPPAHGYPLFARLASLVSRGGIGAIHVTTADPSSWSQKVRRRLYNRVPALDALRQRIRPGADGPVVPMHAYDLGRLSAMLSDLGCQRCQLQLTGHGLPGALIVFQRPA